MLNLFPKKYYFFLAFVFDFTYEGENLIFGFAFDPDFAEQGFRCIP